MTGLFDKRAWLLAVVLLSGCGSETPGPIWCDETTDLCWQNPQRAGFDHNDTGLNSADAARFCDALVLGGYEDWRLPSIDELRTVPISD